MALNPPLNQDKTPLRLEGEYFIMKRTGVEFEAELANKKKYTGKGYVII